MASSPVCLDDVDQTPLQGAAPAQGIDQTQVQPLRIHKGTPANSPMKTSSIPRALSDISPTEKRRNSPSFHQNTKKMGLKDGSSPFNSSPFNTSDTNASPRLFWQGRDTATPNRFSENHMFPPPNRESSPSPTRKASMERLQRASRVKNSNMFAREQKQEYDPASLPVIERPLANLQGNAYGGSGLEGLRSNSNSPWGHQRTQSDNKTPMFSPVQSPLSSLPSANRPIGHKRTPSKDQISPTKSALSQRLFIQQDSLDSDDEYSDEPQLPDGRTLRGNVKSVTFDAAPPQVNEYEMTTPDLSSIGTGSRENSYDSGEEDDDEDGYYYDGEDSNEHDDSFDESLEDTDKTPVVGPDDWRHVSPSNHEGISDRFEDPFDGPEGSPMPDADPMTTAQRPSSRVDSNGDSRPLPPLPPFLTAEKRSSSSGQLEAAERATTSQRGLPLPPMPAASSKSDIQGLSLGGMTLEERLQLMMIGDNPKSAAEEQRERRMRRAAPKSPNLDPDREPADIKIHTDEIDDEDEDTLGDLGEYQLPARPTRESILRKVNGQISLGGGSDLNFSSPPPSSPGRLAHLDPDVAIPSTEEPSLIEDETPKDADAEIVIKSEDDGERDIYSVASMYSTDGTGVSLNLAAMIQQDIQAGEESESHYSSQSDSTPMNQSPDPTNSQSADEDNSPPTPRPSSPIHRAPSMEAVQDVTKSVSLPDFGGFMDKLDFGLGLEDYMSPSPPPVLAPRAATVEPQALKASKQPVLQSPVTPPLQAQELPRPNYDGSEWGPEEGGDEEDGYESSDSVIRHPQIPASPPRVSPSVPERDATIKGAVGSKLKTRQSATPTDLIAMREARRQVSGESQSIPPIPERHRSRPSTSYTERGESQGPEHHSDDETIHTRSIFKRSLTLDLSMDLGLGMDQEIDRAIEKSKKGYLVRKNTKLVVASSDHDLSESIAHSQSKSAGNSPVKDDRPQSWVVEPWNGRRKSFRVESGGQRKRDSAVPPLPGRESNSKTLESLTEGVASSSSEGVPETTEKGRLFVKVIGVKDLDLPLPTSERSWFNLTLDNGVHCVTTAWLELGKNAPIGQEFELVVPNDLEFQLTLAAKLERPEPKRVVESPTKSAKIPKASTFSRVFTSPKKRKQMELALKEEEAREQRRIQQETANNRARSQPSTWDLLSPLVADDGSFGRSYVCLKDHENQCFGRPYIVDIAAFNEWATEDATATSSVKSKRGNTHVTRRAPYKVGKLELQLLFVPKPKGVKDEDMPKSMNACIRQMKDAEVALTRSFEGHLSQQGGDCPYWRRRFFRLSGSKLTAYHELTGQPRATINLANASKLIDDRRTLSQQDPPTKSGGRRKSGFAEDEEGFLFIEEGFRIRFANGEVIDFYADNRKDKDAWMKALDLAIGKVTEAGESKAGKWCELVLKKEEKAMKMREAKQQGRKSSGTSSNGGRGHSRVKSMIV